MIVSYQIGTTGQYTAPMVPLPRESAALTIIRAGSIERIAAAPSRARGDEAAAEQLRQRTGLLGQLDQRDLAIRWQLGGLSRRERDGKAAKLIDQPILGGLLAGPYLSPARCHLQH